MLHVMALWIGLMAPAGGGDAKLLLTVDPGDSAVQVDGKDLKGFKSGTPVSLKPGNAVVAVVHSGYGSQKRTVKLVAGETTRVSIRLEKKDAKPAPVAKRPTAAPKPAPKADAPAVKPRVATRPGARPAAHPTIGGKPKAKPRDDDGPIAGGPKPVTKPVPKDDDRPVAKPQPKPKDDDRPVAKPKPKDETPPPSRPRPVHKPHVDARPVASPQPGTGADYPPDSGRTSLKPYAALSFIVGGLALTGGVVAGVYANKSADEFNHERRLDVKQDLKTQTEERALASNVLYGVGATGMLVGALLWAMDPGDGGHAEVAPLPEGGAMVGWGGTF